LGRGNFKGAWAVAFALAAMIGVSSADGAPAAGQQDSAASLERYRLGAAQGNVAALSGLASLFESGGGGTRADLTTAYALYHLGASMPGGDPQEVARAAASRDAVAARMSAAQVTRAQELIALCYGNDIRRCSETILAGAGVSVGALATPASVPAGGKTTVALEQFAGVYVVPAVVNGVINMKFAVDTGATDVSIPADVVAALTKAGLVTSSDFLGERTYVLADGSKLPAQTLMLRSLKVGDVVVQNVRASVAPEKGIPLLGQSFFSRLKSWSLNNTSRTLIME